MDDGAWFLPKRYGYGAGLPIRWQGWALVGGYVAVVIAAASLVREREPFLFAAILVVATAALIAVSALKTRGGWRWRWDGD